MTWQPLGYNGGNLVKKFTMSKVPIHQGELQMFGWGNYFMGGWILSDIYVLIQSRATHNLVILVSICFKKETGNNVLNPVLPWTC